MPKNKSHRGLLKRIKLTKSGKVRFKAPNSRHLKSNKTGVAVQSFRKSRYARTGDLRYLKKLLSRGLRSEEQSVADDKARAAGKATSTTKAKKAPAAPKDTSKKPTAKKVSSAAKAAKTAPAAKPAKTAKAAKAS